LITSLPWDSTHFGVPIGRVDGGSVTRDELADADRNGLKCVYLLLDTAAGGVIRDAEDLGFRFVDVRITLERPVSGVEDPEPTVLVRTTRPADLEQLEPIVSAAHDDSRFFSDEHFDRDAARDLYVHWLRQSVAGSMAEFTLSAVRGERVVGYITGQAAADPDVLSIGLLGVDVGARRQGAGRALISAFLAEARGRGYDRVDVVTQGSNVAAQRAYQAAGFGVLKSEVWLHRWT
jgi:ribosomal protein S18 acetylase RimI-like enzyme